jgi:flagellar biosynthesis protein FliP
MDHVNIISKEAIMAVPDWLAILGVIICTSIILTTFVYWAIVKDVNKVPKYLGIAGTCALIVCVAWAAITTLFFKEPTGRYRYEATIDEESMTVAEYEEFMDAYNHSHHKDGIYYFEDWID